jgi:membrane-associated phospholipid phosphatase
MGLKGLLFSLSVLSFIIFTIFSYSVAKEVWQKTDFDTTVKLQDHLSRHFDHDFSYFSILGSAEVTITLAGLMAIFELFRKRFWAAVAWMVIAPASLFEVFGKLVVFHPAPPDFFHRNDLIATLPSFYIQTNYSYPSGHLTRTVFLVTVFLLLTIFSQRNLLFKLIVGGSLILFGILMFITRIYLGEHWLSDVLGGSMLGLSAGLLASIFIIKKKYVSMN